LFDDHFKYLAKRRATTAFQGRARELAMFNLAIDRKLRG
jgi:hypothetical protein